MGLTELQPHRGTQRRGAEKGVETRKQKVRGEVLCSKLSPSHVTQSRSEEARREAVAQGRRGVV